MWPVKMGCIKHKFPQVVYPPICRHYIFLTSGLPGCRNIRDGGDTVCEGESGPFLVYLVHRSLNVQATQRLQHEKKIGSTLVIFEACMYI